MKKRASFLAAIGAVVFGSQPAQAVTDRNELPPQTRHVEPTRVQRNEPVFRSEREREQWCALTERWMAQEAKAAGRPHRVSRKFLRELQRRVDKTRHPEAFEP